MAFVMCMLMGVPALAAGPQETIAVTKVADELMDGGYVMSLEGEEDTEVVAVPEADDEDQETFADLITPPFTLA